MEHLLRECLAFYSTRLTMLGEANHFIGEMSSSTSYYSTFSTSDGLDRKDVGKWAFRDQHNG